MKNKIKKAAVLGAGIMGSRIAAHLANASIPVYLLDIVPGELSTGEKGIEKMTQDPVVRNRIAAKGVEDARKSKPDAFFLQKNSELITTGNFIDNVNMLNEADWIIEAVVERLDIKRKILQLADENRKPGSFVSTNTSGIPVSILAEGRSEDFKKHFCGTHFFNPPRYMKLLEIIPGPYTQPEVLDYLSEFCEFTLGKRTVRCKDTPNFIANRIGVFAMLNAINTMIEMDMTIEEADLITGPVTGKPKSATFRTGDMVGIDTLVHVADNLYDAVPFDEQRETFRVPLLINSMVKNNWLGDKTGQGFYKRIKSRGGESEILTLDYKTMEYRPKQKPDLKDVNRLKQTENLNERLTQLASSDERAGRYFWKTLSAVLLYAAARVPEISDDIISIDNAMKWGFNWELGPFETWDVLGVKKTVSRLRDEGKEIPELVENLLASGAESFYKKENGVRFYFDWHTCKFKKEPHKEELIILPALKEQKKTILKNSGASLIDIGDGVACLEFHSKMNAIGDDILQMIRNSVNEVSKNFTGMVIGNQGSNFSVGANLMLILMLAQDDNWDELDYAVRAFQNTNMALKYCEKPVAAAPFGMALGGGCEVCLSSSAVNASAELYMGLVEVGVGLIPAGGGTKEMLIRSIQFIPEESGADLFPFVRKAFETIGMAKVSTSAAQAAELGYLRPADRYSMNGDYIIHDAKEMVLSMAGQNYKKPDSSIKVPVLGQSALANLKIGIHLMHEAGYISDYDAHIGRKLAGVLCGGQLTQKQKVSEQYLLDLEREAFLSLLGERKTQERIKYMLEKGKPLRN
ncbi:MAG: 3-hydroxyacyl-CoA dehydrogenase/enoyl-CoA hydratase family protein [Syntrophothermus sp.]